MMPDDLEYDAAETLASIGLHGAYYMVVFYLGECTWFARCHVKHCVKFPPFPGVDYQARDMENMLLDVEFHDGGYL